MSPASHLWLLPLFALACSHSIQTPTPEKTPKPSESTRLLSAVNDLRVERNSAEAYVLRAKLAQPPVQAEARKLYDDARAKYNAYIETFLDSVRQASKADLQSSLKPAADAAARFKEYVDTNTKAMGPGVLIPIGKVILDAITTMRSEAAKKNAAERKELADEWAKTLPWKAWDVIK